MTLVNQLNRTANISSFNKLGWSKLAFYMSDVKALEYNLPLLFLFQLAPTLCMDLFHHFKVTQLSRSTQNIV